MGLVGDGPEQRRVVTSSGRPSAGLIERDRALELGPMDTLHEGRERRLGAAGGADRSHGQTTDQPDEQEQ